MDRPGIRDIAVAGARVVRECAAAHPESDWVFEYSPESFTGTELDFAVEMCDAVNDGVAADAGAQGHHQPAGHRRDVDAERVRRPDRVDVAGTSRTATRSCCPCILTTIAAAGSLPPSSR